MLTGESLPVEKIPGANVFAGTANINGRLTVRVTATGDSTALAHIIAAVERAQNSRADIQRIGDRVSSVFVPVVVMIALLAGLAWTFEQELMLKIFSSLDPQLWPTHPPTGPGAGFIIAAAVLIVACPCAMGLATPAAIMAAANAAARRGILIRDGVALEKAGKITAIVFDKTGTLTEGCPKVVASRWFQIELPDDLRGFKIEELAASLASMSNHPLSKAIAESNATRHPIKDFQELPGKGVTGLFPAEAMQPHCLELGSLRWLEEGGTDCIEARYFGDEWMNKAATVIGLSIDTRLVALFALKDTPKRKSLDTLYAFKSSSEWTPKIFMVSGDSKCSVDAFADDIGLNLDNVFSEVRPEQKAEFIKSLQARGERVAFVGDGINDAPALTQADLGIAVSRASDVARGAADIVLLKSDIEAVPEALALARATLRTIKQNLFWAFFYNAAAIPLAAMGFMSPVLCAAAMGFSDIIVIGNALRLARMKFSQHQV